MVSLKQFVTLNEQRFGYYMFTESKIAMVNTSADTQKI